MDTWIRFPLPPVDTMFRREGGRGVGEERLIIDQPVGRVGSRRPVQFFPLLRISYIIVLFGNVGKTV